MHSYIQSKADSDKKNKWKLKKFDQGAWEAAGGRMWHYQFSEKRSECPKKKWFFIMNCPKKTFDVDWPYWKTSYIRLDARETTGFILGRCKMQWWAKIMFYYNDGLSRVWRKPLKAIDSKSIAQTVKFGKISVMFWRRI